MSKRHPLVVLRNVKHLVENNASDSELNTYLESENYSSQELSNIPVPENLESVAKTLHIVNTMIDNGANAQTISGLQMRIATDPTLLELAPDIGQISGGVVGKRFGGNIGSKVLGTAGATIGESYAQAIKLIRGDTVSPEEAMKEIIHTGQLALASELTFGAGSPGEKILTRVGKNLALGLKKSTPIIKESVSRILSLTGKVKLEDFKELLNIGADKVLIPRFLAKSVPVDLIHKATAGMNAFRKAAQKDFSSISTPLERNKYLTTSTQKIADKWKNQLIELGIIDQSGKPVLGAFRDITNDEVSEIFKRMSQLTSVETKTGRVPRKLISFRNLLRTRRELSDLQKFSKGTLSVNPRSDRFQAALYALEKNISGELHRLGGSQFELADNAFSDSMKIFDDLETALKTPQKAENSLETIIKNNKQFMESRLKDLDSSLPDNLKFYDELKKWNLAQNFVRQTPDLLRAGILGTILGFKGMTTAGIPGLITGLGSAVMFTSPRGVGLLAQLSERLAKSGVLQKSAQKTFEATARTLPSVVRRGVDSF